MRFEWLSPPPSESVLRALEGLIRAGMIDQEGALTDVGAKVAECPVEVAIARMVGLDGHAELYHSQFMHLDFSSLARRSINAARKSLQLRL
jgi:HrpA-like RNA helicase